MSLDPIVSFGFAAFVTHKFSELIQLNSIVLIDINLLEDSHEVIPGIALIELLAIAFQANSELFLVKNVVAVLVIEPEVAVSQLLSTHI